MGTQTLLKTMGSRRPYFIASLSISVALAVALLTVGLALASPDQQPKTTHAVQGRENCLTCHPVGGGVKPSPASHSAYSNAMCLGCHPAGDAAPAAPVQAPQPATAATSQPSAASAQAAPPQPAAGPDCIDCHKNKDLSLTFTDGEKLSLFVDDAQMNSSVHGGKLVCTDCHSRITGFPHKPVQVSSRRDYSLMEYEACKRCHFANYTKTLDSNHYKLIEAGNKGAPTCTDCHGYHNVTQPDEPRSKISKSCGTCHVAITDQYSKSVHGAAITNGGSEDVPTCTDCHGSHTIKEADTAAFRLNSPELCAKCHSDATKMARYGLSPNVYSTYMNDFHGVTVSLTKRQGPDNWTAKAVCTDCHGVHDIKSTKGGNTAEIKKNLQATCQKCHPDGGANFPDSWMMHYQLSLEKTPLPWLVRGFYWLVIPFMLGGLFLHMIVDLWRLARNR